MDLALLILLFIVIIVVFAALVASAGGFAEFTLFSIWVACIISELVSL